MEGGFLMQNYSLIPATVSTNIKHGTFTYTQNGDGEISFVIYKTPDKDFVYKASLCSLNSHTEPFNLGTFKPENDIYHLEFKMPLHDNDLAIVIYLKDTKEKDINRYVDTLRNFYNIKETIIQADSFDITELNTDDVIQIIPQEKSSKFEKNKFTILQIEVINYLNFFYWLRG